jgi:membrane-bound inhibitor of C-type lysozyme
MKAIPIAKAGFCAVLAASLAGCGGFNFSIASLNPWGGSTEQVRRLPADATEYACDGGKRLIVRYLTGPDAAMIVFRERQFRLDPAPTAASSSGARYTNGSTTLLSSGEQVSLEEEGAMTYTACRKASG